MKEPNEIVPKFQSLSFQIHDNITYFFCGTHFIFLYIDKQFLNWDYNFTYLNNGQCRKSNSTLSSITD